MTELELLVDLHRNSERQGPGSVADTLKALSFLDIPNDKKLHIADLGCGSGGQTITLAEHLNANISAIDLFPTFLDELNAKAKAKGLTESVTTYAQSIDDLQFESETFDLIWSEGAIYNIGFEKGLKYWSKFLKPGGYLAVSEITWITQSRPKEIETFWTSEYPEIDVASNKIKQLEANGYTLTGYFRLGQQSWIENYYQPLESKFNEFLHRHNHSEHAKQVVEGTKSEMDLYERFKAFYSYGFYIARKN